MMLRLTYMGTLMIVTVSSGHNLQQQGLRLSSAASENEYATAIADFTDEVILVPRASRDENHSGKSSTRRIQSSDPSDHYFCGIGFADASSSCAYPCPSGSKSECPSGYLCYFDTPCDIHDLPPEQDPSTEQSAQMSMPLSIPSATTPALWPEDDSRLSSFCGDDWAHASESCQMWCPDGNDDICPYGQSCFSDTLCKYTRPPTNRPSHPNPTRSPTVHPTDPTTSPTIGPLLEHPSNHMFCATDVLKAPETCSLETHCPNGVSDCMQGEYCWTNVMECDVREFIPFEEGGLLGKPEDPTSGMTDKELALSLGFTWPSLKESDHYFCGVTLENANSLCAIPCSDGTAVACDHGQLCFYGTECDARLRPDYYMTDSPVAPPSPAPINREDRRNFSFCGVDWAEANTCLTKWCGKDESCPEGKSCFADTECNVLDQPPMKPTKSPTWSPVTYDDEANNFFCGETYLDACEKCSIETYCRTGKHSECGPNSFCWPGVTCNVKDMEPEITLRPTIDSAEPTKSPIPFDDPSNFRFCGFNWTDASSSCTDGRIPRWCPTGSENECPNGQQCFADTMCHISTVVFPPSLEPTVSPTNYTSSAPTLPAAAYDDPIFTSFCGPTYLDASAACSIDTYCPSGVHADCPENQYCWSATTCNVHDFWPPPTPRPSNPPSHRYFPSIAPSGEPSAKPTAMPTASPLGESDPRNFMYCGTSWDDAALRCRIKCPDEICPGDLSCFAQTGCPAVPNDSSAPTASGTTSVPTFLLSESNASYIDINQTDSPSNFSLVNSESNSQTVSAADSVSTLVSTSPSGLSKSTLTFPMSASPTLAPESISLLSNSTAPTLTNPQPTVTELTWSSGAPSAKPHASSYEVLDLPDVSLSSTPKPPSSNLELVLNTLRNASQSLENKIFVVETRGGSVLKSNLYTYRGFESSIIYYSTFGVNEDYFYLGELDAIEAGIVNLALFLSKVATDTIAYESCDPNKLACGMWALDSTFYNNFRFQCSTSSGNAGLECLDASIGCACILGTLDFLIGSKSPSGSSSYSHVNFCLSDPYQSICSRYVDKGEELRWLVPMSYWVSFVQRYSSSVADTYITGLKKIVQGGMKDTTFVEFVAEISVFPLAEKASKEKFLANYFKIVELLWNNMPEQSTLVPSKTLTTSSVPWKPVSTTPAPLEMLTSSPLSSPTELPVKIPATPMPSNSVDNQSLVNYCPVLCVVPIKTSECPSPGQNLKPCFGKSILGVDELCLAVYGECGTSSISVNDCAKSYNVFRRIDCSILVDLEQSTPEEAPKASSPALDELPPTSSPTTGLVSSISPTRKEHWRVDTPLLTSTTSPTTEQYSSFGGKVWWENISSSGQSTQPWRALYTIIILVTSDFAHS